MKIQIVTDDGAESHLEIGEDIARMPGSGDNALALLFEGVDRLRAEKPKP